MSDDTQAAGSKKEGLLRAQRLKLRREALGLTMREIAVRLGIPQNRYATWERYMGEGVATENLQNLANALDVTDVWLYNGDSAEDEKPADNGQAAPGISSPTQSMRSSLNNAARELLSQRAWTQRKMLGLSVREVAEAIGINTLTLRNWEKIFPRMLSLDRCASWETVLRVEAGWLRAPSTHPLQPMGRIHRIADADKDTSPHACTLHRLVLDEETVAQEIRAIGAWLSRRTLAHRTAHLDKLSAKERRDAEIFAQRYGVAGDERSTLQEIGDAFGLTRERIRMIVDKSLERAQDMQFETPRLRALEQGLQGLLPVGLEDADTRFHTQLGESLSLRTVDVFAREVLGKSFYSVTGNEKGQGVKFKRYLVPTSQDDDSTLRLIRDKAREMIRVTGAAHIFFVAGAAGQDLGLGVLPEEVRRSIQLVPGFSWLNESDGWFWFGEEPENRLLNAAKKMLIAARGRLDVEDILAGAMRSRRHSTNMPLSQKNGGIHVIEPPWEVVREVLRTTSWCKTVQHNDFVLVGEFREEDVLSEVEHHLCTRLREQGGVVAFGRLKKDLAQAGLIKNASLSMLLANSPIIYRPEFGLVAIRGIPMRSVDLERARNEVGSHLSLPERDFPDEDGFFHITAEFTVYIAKSRFWEVPQRLAHHLNEGQYQLQGFSDPVEIKRLPSGSTRIRKLVSKIISMGLKPGMLVDMAINPDRRLIRIETAIK